MYQDVVPVRLFVVPEGSRSEVEISRILSHLSPKVRKYKKINTICHMVFSTVEAVKIHLPNHRHPCK